MIGLPDNSGRICMIGIMLFSLPSVAMAACCSTTNGLSEMIRAAGGGTSVTLGVDSHGLRGLVVSCDACVGDVILEVPLSLCLSDCCSDDHAMTLKGAAPAWAASLPWNVQLAANIMTRQQDPNWSRFLHSWPDPPALPKDCELDELAIAGDSTLEIQADEACFWLDEQFWALQSAASDQSAESELSFTMDDFTQAMVNVWSRCLKLSAGKFGVRRLLVPLLDMANHEPQPSALFAFSPAAGCGPAIRLHAAQPLRKGDAVTITYGAHTTAHFALYYGFVPRVNPFDAFEVSVGLILSLLPEEFLGESPAGGWEAAIAALPEEMQGNLLLKAAGPPEELVKGLCLLFGHTMPSKSQTKSVATAGRAVRALEIACARLRHMLLCGLDSEAALRRQLGTLSAQGELLLGVRMSRLRLISEVHGRLSKLAAEFEDAIEHNRIDGGGAPARLIEMQAEAKRDAADFYPALDEVPIEELTSWSERCWDWEAGAYAS